MEDREEGNCVYYETRSRLRVISGQPSVISLGETRSHDREIVSSPTNEEISFRVLHFFA